jgi:hypothetical protein
MTLRPVASARWLSTSLIALGPLSAVLLFVRCFNPSLPTCSYRCDTKDRACPPEYECRSDSICHLKGSTEACSFTFDLSAPTLDLASQPDQASPADMAPADM